MIEAKKILARDVMNRKVVSINPDALIFDAAKIISEHNYDGLPVIDDGGRLVGIVTEYDLINRTSSANVSFLSRILTEVRAKKEGLSEILEDEAKELSSLKVFDIMNKEPLALKEDATFEEVVAAFIAHHRVNPIPIVDINNRVIGIVSRFDVLRPLNLIGYGLLKK